jgi:hypothetical protein
MLRPRKGNRNKQTDLLHKKEVCDLHKSPGIVKGVKSSRVRCVGSESYGGRKGVHTLQNFGGETSWEMFICKTKREMGG